MDDFDTVSTVSLSSNKDLLNNIHFCKAEDRITILTNGSSKDFDMVGDLNDIPLQLYLNADFIAKIQDVCPMPGVILQIDIEVDVIYYV